MAEPNVRTNNTARETKKPNTKTDMKNWTNGKNMEIFGHRKRSQKNGENQEWKEKFVREFLYGEHQQTDEYVFFFSPEFDNWNI